MASLTQYTWIWANSGKWWRTGKPEGLHAVHGVTKSWKWLATEQQQCGWHLWCPSPYPFSSPDFRQLWWTLVMPAAAAAKSLQLCPTLCDPTDGSPPGSTIPGILQAGTLGWVAISFSNAWKWKVKVKSLSRVWLLATAWTAAYQAPPSMGFSKQEYWSGLLLPSLLVMPSTPQVQICGGWYSAFYLRSFRTMESHSAWISKGVKTPRSNFRKWRLSPRIKPSFPLVW